MRKSFAALILLALGAGASANAGPAPAVPTCANWGTPDSAGVISWETGWFGVDGKERIGAFTFTLSANDRLVGSWGDGAENRAVWSNHARTGGPTLSGRWGQSAETPSGTFLIRRWRTPSKGADGAYYCSFDGEYTINGDRNRYKWAGWRRAN